MRGTEAGADEFITKPFDQANRPARVRSLVRVKRYDDTSPHRRGARRVEPAARGAGPARWTTSAPGPPAPFLSPDRRPVVDSGDESFLKSHRREITPVFTDLRGFTALRGAVRAEETMEVLSAYHHALGELVFAYEGTLEHFAGDGLLVFFNDPVPRGTYRTSVRCGWQWTCGPGLPLLRVVAAPRPRGGVRGRHRPGLRDARPDRLPRSRRLRGHRDGHQPRGPALRQRRGGADPRHPEGAGRRAR